MDSTETSTAEVFSLSDDFHVATQLCVADVEYCGVVQLTPKLVERSGKPTENSPFLGGERVAASTAHGPGWGGATRAVTCQAADKVSDTLRQQVREIQALHFLVQVLRRAF